MLRTDKQFARVRVICNQSDLSYDDRKLGVVFRVNHGDSVKLASAINVFAMYCESKVCVFAVKVMEDGDAIKLMKTAVIDCDLPVFCISVSVGFLMLGEENGVRVFKLRPLVKGRVERSDKSKVRKFNLTNGMIAGNNGSSVLYVKSGKGTGGSSSNYMNVNDNMEEKIGKQYDNSGELMLCLLTSYICSIALSIYSSGIFGLLLLQFTAMNRASLTIHIIVDHLNFY